MTVSDYFIVHRQDIIKRWVDLIIRTYPDDSRRFLKRESDPFGNPVGQAIIGGTEVLYDQITGAMDQGIIVAGLEKIIKIRAVQEFSASQAVGFVFLLKEALEKQDGKTGADSARLLEVHRRIDLIALKTFDIYMDCRETVNRIRLEEAKRRLNAGGVKLHHRNPEKPDESE